MWQAISQSFYTVLWRPESQNGRTVNEQINKSKWIAKQDQGENKVQMNAPHWGDGQSIIMLGVISSNAWQNWCLIYKSSYLLYPNFLDRQKVLFIYVTLFPLVWSQGAKQPRESIKYDLECEKCKRQLNICTL